MLRILLRLVISTSVLAALVAAAGRPAFLADPDYLIDTWETEQGLPESSATAMAQTLDGYLWFGTFNGLVRFDGVRFTVFNPANTPDLPSAGIVNLHRDRLGRLWISTDRGLVVLDGKRWRRLGADAGWAGNYVRTFAERANGDLLLTTFDGHVLECVGGRLSELPAPPGTPGQGYFGHADEAGDWWVVQNRFVGRWDGQRWIETIPLQEPVADAIGSGTAPNGQLLLVVRQELRRWRGGGEALRLPLSEPFWGGIWAVSEDRQGHVWVCTYDKGLARIHPDGTLRRWTTANGLSSNVTRFVFEDREGNLWIGTSGGGLMRFKPRRFQIFGAEEGLVEPNARSVAPDGEGGMWIGTYGSGLFHWEAGGITQTLLPDIPTRTVYCQAVHHDRAGRTWVGTYVRGAWQLDEQGARRIPPAETGGATITSIFEDSRGRVWVGGDRGLAVFENGVSRPLPTPIATRLGGIVGMAEDSDGSLWLSNLLAVFRLDEDQLSEISAGTGQSLRDILCLLPNADGSVWMGSRDEGLLRWASGKLSRLDAAAGFPVSGVHAILEDDRGYFWMPTKRGVIRARRSELEAAAKGGLSCGEYQVLDASDGLASVDCPSGLQPVCARDPAGRLWFATLKGVAMLDPEAFRLNAEPPPVHIETLAYRVGGSGRDSDSQSGGKNLPNAAQGDARLVRSPRDATVRVEAPFTPPLRLSPGSHRIEIRYTALSFVAPEKVRFQVKLEGRDAEWQEPEIPRVAFLDELRPRDYVFRVRAANNDGVWNEAGASLAFTVLPHYWQTQWFRFGLGLGLAGLGAAVAGWASRARVRRALEREQAANEIQALAGRLINAQEEERRRIARELHDDFSQQLALLSVEMDVLNSPAGGAPSSPTPRLREMAARVKELSSEVHRMAYELHPAKLDQLGLVAAARAFCRELAQQSGLRITFEPGSFPRDVPADLALCFYRIIQESLQNAVRHSGAPEARVELRAEPERVCLTISDSGRGFDVERARREGGLGLSSMQERVRHLQGTLVMHSEPGRGTRVDVCVPRRHNGRGG